MIIDRIPSDCRVDCAENTVETDQVPSEPRADMTSNSERVYQRVARLDSAARRRRMLFVDLAHASDPQDLIIESIPAIHVDNQRSLGVRDPGCEETDILYRDTLADGGVDA